MTKQGFVLVATLILMMVLTIILGVILLISTNENNLVRRHINNTRAFWAAEAGVAEAIRHLPNSPINGNIGNDTYHTTTTPRPPINSRSYYDIRSVGTVTLQGGITMTRTIDVVVNTGLVDPSKFQYAIRAANDLCFGGGCKKNPYNYINPPNPPGCNGHDCFVEFDNTINFADQFGQQLNSVNALATHYTDSNFVDTVSGVTWVDVASGGELSITGSDHGSGILIVNGNLRMAGTYVFDGIIYVLGTFKAATGTPTINGSVVVASTSEIDTINGTPNLNWNVTQITNALNQLALMSVDMVSWKESTP